MAGLLRQGNGTTRNGFCQSVEGCVAGPGSGLRRHFAALRGTFTRQPHSASDITQPVL